MQIEKNKIDINKPLFSINSKDNTGFSINYGSFVKNKDGKLNNLFPISESDVGSALYDINGNVIKIVAPNGTVTANIYDNMSRLIQKIDYDKNNQTDDAVNEYKEYICNQVLATSLTLADEVNGTELEFDDFKLYALVSKC